MQAEGETCQCEACGGPNGVSKHVLLSPLTAVLVVSLVVASPVLICLGIVNDSTLAWLIGAACAVLAVFFCSVSPTRWHPKRPTIAQVHSWSGFLALLAIVAVAGWWFLWSDGSKGALVAGNPTQTVFAVIVLVGLAAKTMSHASDVDEKSKSWFEALAEVCIILGALGTVIAKIG